jgi:hypothetical protein
MPAEAPMIAGTDMVEVAAGGTAGAALVGGIVAGDGEGVGASDGKRIGGD